MQQLKESLINAPRLIHDNETDQLVIRTDRCNALLAQRPGRVAHHFICRRTSAAEEHYHSNVLECLALVWALEKLLHYLYGRHFIVHTDNSPLKWLCTKKKLEGRLVRWGLALKKVWLHDSAKSFYRYGPLHQHSLADSLGRSFFSTASLCFFPVMWCHVPLSERWGHWWHSSPARWRNDNKTESQSGFT